MRVLLVHPGPDFSVNDVFAGWMEALHELGVDVAPFNTNDRLVFYSRALMDTGLRDNDGHQMIRKALSDDAAWKMALQGLSHALYTFWPDVVMFISGFYMPSALFGLMRQRGHKIVILHTESPYQDDEQLRRGSLADLNLLNDPANLEMFREEGPAEYMPHAYRPSIHYPARSAMRNPDLASDLCFVGTMFASRLKFFEDLDLNGIDLILAGNDWGTLTEESPVARYVATGNGNLQDCVDNDQVAELYRQAKAGLNLYRREGESTHKDDPAEAMSPREIEMAACGLAFIRDRRPEGDRVLHMLPQFEGAGEAGEQLRWLLKHDREREKMAAEAREAVADRTFGNNAKWLLKLIEKL